MRVRAFVRITNINDKNLTKHETSNIFKIKVKEIHFIKRIQNKTN